MLGRFAALHRACDRIRLLFPRIAGPAHAAGKFRAVTLLHHVGRFVRGEIHVGLIAERNAIARRVGQRAHVTARFGSGAAHGRARTCNVVASK